MASTKISDMTAATTPNGAVYAIVQSGDNKKITDTLVRQTRVQTVTSAATVTPNADTDDMVVVTAQAETLTVANPSGTPTQGQGLVIRIKDNGTTRTVTWGTYGDERYREFDGVTLPTSTNGSDTHYIACVYNSTDSVWDVIGVNTLTVT